MKRLKRAMKSLRIRIILAILAIFLSVAIFSVSFMASTITGVLQEQTYSNYSALVMQTNNSWQEAFALITSSMTNFYSAQSLDEWLDSSQINSPDAMEKMLPNVKLDQTVIDALNTDNALNENLINSLYFSLSPTCYSMFYRGNYKLQSIMQQSLQILRARLEEPEKAMQCYPPALETSYFFIAHSGYAGIAPRIQMNLILSVDERALYRRYNPLLQYENMITVLINDEGIIYSSPNVSEIGTKLDKRFLVYRDTGDLQQITIDGEIYYVSSCSSSELGLSFLTVLPQKELLSVSTQAVNHYVLILVLVLAVLTAASTLLVFKSTHFIKEMAMGAERINSGDYSALLPSYTTTELSEVSSSFNAMVEKIDYLINEVYEKQLALNQADMRFFQSQINPHFLFNALAAISTKALLAEDKQLYRMVSSLSTLLRASLRTEKNGISSVADEMECVRCYLLIQKERFAERFSYDIQIDDPSILNESIPRLCVEPLVENAVVHGFEEKRGNGYVHVHVTRDQNELVFIVTDNGPGFPDNVKQPEDLLSAENDHVGIGLHNTNRRLKLLYGEKYAVKIDTTYRAGARVVVRIPCAAKENTPCTES